MIFVMKNNIKPIWEDTENAKGGCFSYKISLENVYDVWKKLNYYLLGETLIEDIDVLKSINGISISPKKNYCIIKLWINNTENLKNNNIYKFFDSENNIEAIDPFNIEKLCSISKQLCIFKYHNLLY
tara:strand:- start:325 stop:705 length:381 start_codon:yes stop_codon:yes gene_type:complete